VTWRKDRVVVDLPPAALDILSDDVKDILVYQVVKRDGSVIAGEGNLSAIEPGLDTFVSQRDRQPEQQRGYLQDARLNGQDVRLATVSCPVPGKSGDIVTIRVAQTLNGRQKLADDILVGVVLPQLFIVFLSAVIVLFGVRRGLAPLNNLRDEVSARTPLDLKPIPQDRVPKEVRPLVVAINNFMERLRCDMESQQRFVANAAHQLRTPIAGLKTQTELALRQTDPEDVRHALSLIRLGAERAAKLTNQLLTLARSEPSVVDVEKFQLIDLNNAVRNIVKELASLAEDEHIDLGFAGTEHSILVKGDPVSLHELVSNLIENAVHYTQSGGSVNVSVALEAQPLASNKGPGPAPLLSSASIRVEDNGPGIAVSERERVFERFYRICTKSSGSGLGLAIVKEIARAHNASVSLTSGANGLGTAVTVTFDAISLPEIAAPGSRAPALSGSRLE
jgi:two-component system sensor histidine kinase TctE